MEKLNTHSQQIEEISIADVLNTLRRLWRYLLSKWLIVLGAGIFGLLIGVSFSIMKKRTYNAVTTFVLEGNESGGSLGQYAGLASMMGIDVGGAGGGIFQGENILELYRSRTMIQKVLLTKVDDNSHKVLLIDQYIEANGLKEKWAQSNPKLSNIQFGDYQKTSGAKRRLLDSVISAIVQDINKNYLSVTKPDKKLSIIQVDVKSENEFFAKEFNDQIVRNVNDFYIQTRTKKSKNNIDILQQKTDSVRLAMNSAIYRSVAASDATPNLNITRQVQRLVPMQKSQFTAEANKAILSELVKNLEMSKMALLKETPLIQVIDQPIYPLSVTHYSKLTFGLLGFLGLALLSSLILLLARFFKHR